MLKNVFLDLLKLESKKLSLYFNIACLEGEGTSQEIADRKENVARQFFEKYFPYPFRITKGNINDSFGNRSGSIDCVILNPSHPNTIDKLNEKSSVIFADAVDFAIEIKSTLKGSEIERALKQIISVKKLNRKHVWLSKGNGDEELQKKIPSIIFCEKTIKNKELLVNKIMDYYNKNHIKRAYHFDIIAINNDCIIFNSNTKAQVHLKTDKIILYYSKEKTLAFLLFLMNSYPLSEPRMVESLIKSYLTDTIFNDIDRVLFDIITI